MEGVWIFVLSIKHDEATPLGERLSAARPISGERRAMTSAVGRRHVRARRRANIYKNADKTSSIRHVRYSRETSTATDSVTERLSQAS